MPFFRGVLTAAVQVRGWLDVFPFLLLLKKIVVLRVFLLYHTIHYVSFPSSSQGMVLSNCPVAARPTRSRDDPDRAEP